MARKLYLYLTLMLAMTACSMEDIDLPSGLSPDGELTINLTVPDIQTIETRVDESAISSATLLVVTDGRVKQKIDLTSSLEKIEKDKETSTYQTKCTIRPELRTVNPKLYFVCNTPSDVTFAENESESEILGSQKSTTNVLNGDNMVLSGVTTLNEIVSKKGIVPIYRNAVKVSVTKGIKKDEVWSKGTVNYPFKVYGTASDSQVLSGAMGSINPGAATEQTVAADFIEDAIPYYHPTQNNGRNEKVRPFIIVKAPYKSPITNVEKDYFYRVEFEKKEENTDKIVPLNLISNHEYQVVVTDILGEGDATPAAAAKNPSSLIQVDIYDFCPTVYNMITDGIRELGVSHQLTHNGNPSPENEPEYFYVKIYSHNESNYALTKDDISIPSSLTWLRIGEPELVTNPMEVGEMLNQESFAGKVYRIPVHFKATSEPGELRTNITVRWGNLSRTIPVLWTRTFNGSELCSASLVIKTGNGVTAATINDYWEFLNSQCLGVNAAHNNDSIRNEGLHFPINYGGKNKRWSYEYTLKFKNLNNGRPYDWKCEVRGKIKKSINLSSSSGKNEAGEVTIVVTRTPSQVNDDWGYETGNLVFAIAAPNSEEYIEYELDLYHTGFFDNPGVFRVNSNGDLLPHENIENHEVGKSGYGNVETDKYYYYEVRKGPQGRYYWLDRNLGAGSAAMYIEVVDGISAGVGEADAMGKYYRAAKYQTKEWTDDEGYHIEFKDPLLYPDLCPPGYEIPSMEIWNTLRNSPSPSFTMALSGTNYLCQFENSDKQIVHFPKVLWYDQSENKTGEERTGYYWTSTPTESLEKNQVGNWLRYFKVAGSMAAFDNAEVEGRQIDGGQKNRGMAMSVRCVNSDERSSQVKRTEFKVQGATNVFLYSEVPSGDVDESGNPIMTRNEVTNWPGRQINIYATKDTPTSYWYESATTLPEQFYVLFNIIDENGVWTTISKAEDGSVKATSEDPRKLKGWKVVNDPHLHSVLYGKWVITQSGNGYSIRFENP